MGLDRTRPAPCVGSCAADATGEAASERSLQLIVPAEDTAPAAECMHTTDARTLDELLPVLDGRREAALVEPTPARAAGVGHERGQPAGALDRSFRADRV